MPGHEVEDVDFEGLTPWEADCLRIGLAALRRRGADVHVAAPEGLDLKAAMPAPLEPPALDPSIKVGDAIGDALPRFAPWDARALSPARPTPPWGGAALVEPDGEDGKPAVTPLSDAELAMLLRATPEEIEGIRRRWPVPGPGSRPMAILADAPASYLATLVMDRIRLAQAPIVLMDVSPPCAPLAAYPVINPPPANLRTLMAESSPLSASVEATLLGDALDPGPFRPDGLGGFLNCNCDVCRDARAGTI